jgi:uncharacterized lipoprotein YddW (UPF0748 family)
MSLPSAFPGRFRNASKAVLGTAFFIAALSTSHLGAVEPPPPVPREFRAAWAASVSNIDWPSKPGLPVEQQKAELLAMLDRAAQMRLNIVILQVRPACDALYASKLEPWSEYLTGTMGKAPTPFYDPLDFAVRAAHQRGLELHAWFNPFRARHLSAFSPISANHISHQQPGWCKTYGKHLWLDPGEKAARDYSVRVICDVVKRYDIDGVHIDDYFYPYRELDGAGKEIAFPDAPSWQRYQKTGGKLARDDWRRENVNLFVAQLNQAVHRQKPWVKFGVSPFGIWRPGVPAGIRGFDPYDKIFADAKKWLNDGCLDYFAPQLYWSINAPGQSFPTLLKWWTGENHKERLLVPGLNTIKTAGAWKPEEIAAQIQTVRNTPGGAGHIHWSIKALTFNAGGVTDALREQIYQSPALPPATPWLDAIAPTRPKAYLGGNAQSLAVHFEPTGREKAQWWVVQARRQGAWTCEAILPAGQPDHPLRQPAQVEAVAVTSVDRCGNTSAPLVVERKKR